jgi:cyclopropane fatty-acyl-phospholipid synthase-like methyltransferase
MNDFWKEFWIKHSCATKFDPPQVQVLRTINKQPISDEEFNAILKDIEEKMDINIGDVVLDLCCGNGLITTYLAPKCKKVVGVDFAQDLTLQIDLVKYSNISIIIEDILRVQFEQKTFDKILIYAGIQYLSVVETIYFFESVVKWLKNDGLFFIGDVPDQSRLWNFYNSNERQAVYFEALKNDAPLIGTWFEPQWLINLGKYSGFKKVDILSQPASLPYSHYRFDMILKK